MEYTKPVQVVMLPTKEPQNLSKDCVSIDKDIWRVCYSPYLTVDCIGNKPQHLYFISTDTKEEIKEGDWCFAGMGYNLIKAIAIYDFKNYYKNCTKIIASTDPALGLPAIPLTWIRDVYVPSNGSIKEVKLETYIELYPIIDEGFHGHREYEHLKLTPDNEVVIVDEPIISEYIMQRLKDIKIKFQQKLDAKTDSLKVDQELEDVAKDHADNWWDSEPDPETDKHFTEEFNEAKKKWAKHDFICGFEQGANWKAEQLAKEIESRTEVIKEYQKAIDQSANDAMEFAKWTQKNDWWYIDEHDYWMEGKWFDTDLERFPSYTLKQIYEIWQQNR